MGYIASNDLDGLRSSVNTGSAREDAASCTCVANEAVNK